MVGKKPKNETFSFVIPGWLKKKVSEEARKKDIPMAECVKDILKTHFKETEVQ
jgi:hypothetical protein